MQILPENIVGKRTIADYLLKEICNSANDLLDNINSIAEIDKEDKYTDLLLLSLQARLRHWGWHVGNERGGFSASNKKNPGELDFIITTADKERLATCEALLIHGKNTSTVTSHNFKIFNYDHRRKLFFIIVYYNGNDFENHWEDYKTNIIPKIKYPLGFPFLTNAEEIQETHTNSSIKAAVVGKLGGYIKYHIFINLNYCNFT